jgi:hypothetical protein
MSWLSEFVFDPIKALVRKGLAAAEADLQALAGKAAAALPSTPISDAAEVAFETSLQSAVDGIVIHVVGEVPVVGQLLEADAVKAANAAIDYSVSRGAALLNAAAAAAKAKLASVAAAPPGKAAVA